MLTKSAASELHPARNSQYHTPNIQTHTYEKQDQDGKRPEQIRRPRIFSRTIITIFLILLGFFLVSSPSMVNTIPLLHDYHVRDHPQPSTPEKIEVLEIPLPPVVRSTEPGSCTLDINLKGTGCMPQKLDDAGFQTGDFAPDGKHVVVTVKLVGAPKGNTSASIYHGKQLLLVKVDGNTFENGDTWKCLTCGASNDYRDSSTDYPHVF